MSVRKAKKRKESEDRCSNLLVRAPLTIVDLDYIDDGLQIDLVERH